MTISQISFRQNNNAVLNKSQNKKNDFSLKTPLEPICAPIYITSLIGGTSLAMDGEKKFIEEYKKSNKLLLCFCTAIIILIGSLRSSETIDDIFGNTNDKKAKNYLIFKQISQSALALMSLIGGLDNAFGKKKFDRKGGIIAACLSGVALAASTISNIATWKNYKKDNQSLS